MTFAQWWETHDTAARNGFLRDQGVKVVVSLDPLPAELALSRPDMIWSVAVIERPDLHAILYMGDLAELHGRRLATSGSREYRSAGASSPSSMTGTGHTLAARTTTATRSGSSTRRPRRSSAARTLPSRMC